MENGACSYIGIYAFHNPGVNPDEDPIDMDAIVKAERDRLAERGYDVTVCRRTNKCNRTRGGEVVCVEIEEPYLLCHASYDQLVHFPAHEAYGYFISLKDEAPNHYK